MLLMFNMMKNSEPNRFIWAHIFKKAPTSEGAHPPSDTPLRRASVTAGADAPFWISQNLAPPLKIVLPPMKYARHYFFPFLAPEHVSNHKWNLVREFIFSILRVHTHTHTHPHKKKTNNNNNNNKTNKQKNKSEVSTGRQHK